MNATRALQATTRTPMIQFLGKRTIPQNIDHTPRAHPEAPNQTLPSSFAEYRKAAQQHGPLGPYKTAPTVNTSIQPKAGEVWDRNQLPQRFWRMPITREEIEIIESGGAAAFA
ncbi:hypothetical protein EDC01DRAFT_206073 [Geopyxis carbonaria]|nr:hypothetical protein EDC01DRAFT_206073 [Geopyxis carbonaria]